MSFAAFRLVRVRGRGGIKPFNHATSMGLFDYLSTATSSKGPTAFQQREMSSKQLVEVRLLTYEQP